MHGWAAGKNSSEARDSKEARIHRGETAIGSLCSTGYVLVCWLWSRVVSCPSLIGTSLVLASKVPHPRKPLRPGWTGSWSIYLECGIKEQDCWHNESLGPEQGEMLDWKHPFPAQHKAGFLRARWQTHPTEEDSGEKLLTQPQLSPRSGWKKGKHVSSEDPESLAHTQVDQGINPLFLCVPKPPSWNF